MTTRTAVTPFDTGTAAMRFIVITVVISQVSGVVIYRHMLGGSMAWHT